MANSFVPERPALHAPHPREATEWIVAYSYNANDDTLPRVLLIGDSICNGYHQFVREELAGVANVAFFATSKCVVDQSYLRSLAFFLDEHDYAAIHFNNGLHSLYTDLGDWENCLRAAVKLLQERGKGAKLIWASSTPLKDPERTAKAQALNAVAARVMAEARIPTNDLFALLDPLDRETHWGDTFHHKDDTRKLCGKAVADRLRAALGQGRASESEAKAALAAGDTETGPDGKL